jgi:hypothetical protein
VLHNDANHAFMYYQASDTRLTTYTASSSGNIATANGFLANALNRGANAWGGASCSVCLNAGVVAVGTFLPYTVGSFGIGSYQLGSAYSLVGCVRNVRFYDTRLSDAELIALTTAGDVGSFNGVSMGASVAGFDGTATANIGKVIGVQV